MVVKYQTPTVVQGDSIDWMREFADAPFDPFDAGAEDPRFDAIVTDPPYGISFMGKEFDSFKSVEHYREWTQEWAKAALEVVKPGAHIAVFGAPRTFAWETVGLHDAGWEIRDTILAWIYGSGFPKSWNLDGDDTSSNDPRCQCENRSGIYRNNAIGAVNDGAYVRCKDCRKRLPPAGTNGYGTALKPAYEPIIIARKALDGTIQGTFDKHGTGALNIDATRIPIGDTRGDGHWSRDDATDEASMPGYEGGFTTGGAEHEKGRWPANVLFDENAAALLDSEFKSKPTGVPISGAPVATDSVTYGAMGPITDEKESLGHARSSREQGSTGPSRFFYTSKASRKERETGLDHFEAVRRSDGREKDIENPRLRTNARRNHHPAIKPLDLMQWLCRLIVPEEGRVLDPFMGSGSTLIAAHKERMLSLGIEKNQEYFEIAEARVAHWCMETRML